jgi:hypothetical protein
MMEKDDNLRKLIRSAGIEEPGKDFTAKLMNKIQAMEKSAILTPAPIISRKAWIVTGAACVLLFFFLIFNTKEGFVSGTSYDLLNRLTSFVPELKSFHEIILNSSLLFLLIVCSALLLLADYFFSYRVRWSR